ncbi:hypothetical protein HNP86_001061 [Methanococcus maripaludis]|uniref:Type I restriction enzyme R protein N-terminal domain-containing protein n=1 Tax=Methanococcus maripaludis TaxID=39152 RepID=A0A7J9S0E9_METMI|nr:type I restriction endonuclease [Methanococcus maripaludis]MBA2850930.1 hypothetical protein [Methanococcus maripaludis]MBB6067759.1 hypothetical protein [Methanococcus maripaludis]
MGFKEDLQKLSAQVGERKDYINNEETTKQSLIIPFVQTLGFEVFNPLEVRPEYIADFGKKKGEKVDYALFKDKKPVIFIEAKSVNENLKNHDAQLSRYFNAVPEVKLAILTNGVEYKFFTDLNSENMMDDSPFLTLNILNLKDSDYETIQKFKKDEFNKEELLNHAEELVYMSALRGTLRNLFKNPNDDFVRFLIKDVSEIRVTSAVIERFRPLVKKAISNTVLDIVSTSLSKDEHLEEPEVIEPETETEIQETENPQKREVITTNEEISAYDRVVQILGKYGKDISDVNYKDTTIYFGIYRKNITNWFLRLNLDSQTKHIITKLDIDEAKLVSNGFEVKPAPKRNGNSRIYINSIDDLEKLENLIVKCYEQLK